ncbi:XRE family transcriptional regulator [Amycolatopsis sp. NPDC024027]|uniref:XRE family transcriptional regulator n=1 Tax=Amycolatopsis sp. NPDC024027 TaxID=3154327 RepID=UPI0033DBD6FD
MASEVVAVPRGERPLEGGDGVVVRFAHDLRILRENAGRPTYRELGARAHYSAAALSEAAGGRKLPTLSVTVAYVAACGGDTAEWTTRWRAIAAELAAANAEPSDTNDQAKAPYLGLAAFEPEDADRFFGRDQLVADLVNRVNQHRFLGVFGSSGCGKSSVLRAGLAAYLTAEREQDDAPVVVFTPGERPFEECAVHLARFLGEAPGTLREEFFEDPRNLHLRIRQAVAGDAADTDVVLIVDQFEELFTLCGDESQRARFIDALVTAAADPASRARVVLGVRADFLEHCGRHHRLVSALYDAQVLVGPMNVDELRQAIVGPAVTQDLLVETYRR